MGCKGSRLNPAAPTTKSTGSSRFLFALPAGGVPPFCHANIPAPAGHAAPRSGPHQPLAHPHESRDASCVRATTTVTSSPASRPLPRRSARSVTPWSRRPRSPAVLADARPSALLSADVQRFYHVKWHPTASIRGYRGCSTTCPTWSSPASPWCQHAGGRHGVFRFTPGTHRGRHRGLPARRCRSRSLVSKTG